MEILSALITLVTGILLICMMQTTFRDSHIFFRIGIALIAAGLLCMTLGPLWGESYTSFPQMLLNVGLLVFVAMLRARQLGWQMPTIADRAKKTTGVR